MRNDSLNTILSHLPGHIRAPLSRAAPSYVPTAQEIILRAERPLVIECTQSRCYLSENGTLTALYSEKGLLKATLSDIADVFRSICEYSVFARQRELNHGYITVKNGVRVGIGGTAVINDNDIVNIKDLTTLNFRIAGEVIGCADELLRRTDPLEGILICGTPCSGKTTVIRDMARILSLRHKLSIIDERNEISATFNGISGYDLGLSDVLVGMEKGGGVIHSLRSLSPDIIVCDEIGDSRDAQTLRHALRCGVSVIATVHAKDLQDVLNRPATADLLNTGAFRYIVQLGDRRHAGQIKSICERRFDKHEAAAVYDDRHSVV